MPMTPCMAERCLKTEQNTLSFMYIYRHCEGIASGTPAAQFSPSIKWGHNSVDLLGLLLNDITHTESLPEGLELNGCSENIQ